MSMWWLLVAVGIAGLAGWGAWLVWGDSLDAPVAVVVAVPILCVALGIVGVVKATDDNPHHLKSGDVTAHKFTPEHTDWISQCTPVGKTTICTPVPYHYGDDWALRLQNCPSPNHCETGWLHFGHDVFEQFPVGSYYRGSRA